MRSKSRIPFEFGSSFAMKLQAKPMIQVHLMCNISHICHSYILDMCRCLSNFHCIDAQKKLLIASPSLNIPMAFYFKHILCIVNMDGELFAKSFGVGPFSIFYLLFSRIFTFRLQCYIFIVCIEGTSVSNSMRFV